jgi:L-alanine-DL-glutamate epimerase-like enolase superfamily enzyme
MQCRVPLPAPVTLGPAEIRFRDYVSLRLVFADGGEGHASGFERGMPLFDIAARMAPLCLGKTAGRRIAVREAQLGPAPASRPVHLRGISLCNIAFWDAFCRQVHRPLWAVLGATRDRVPLMPVIGYGATPERVAAQAADLGGRGFRTIKLMIDGTDAARDRALIEALAGALPAGASFGIDAHWSWRTPADALPTCKVAQDNGAVFVEDPFTPSQWRAIAQLQGKLDVPLAVGEDVLDRHGFRDLAEVAPILRPDASASGGIDGLMEAITLAATHDRAVIPHVFPALHAHAGFATRVVTCVESILPEIGADPLDRFLAHDPRIEGGDLLADDVPGAGTGLRWDDLSALATRTQTFS